jgi:DNA topoisomerase VI subunit B
VHLAHVLGFAWVHYAPVKPHPQGKAGGRSTEAMSEENKAQVRRLLEEGFSEGSTDVVDDVLNPDFVCYDPNSESGEVRGQRP